MEPAGILVLFDIDGTLLRRSGPAHRQALERAAGRVAGVAVSIDGIPVAGMLDRDILLEMLRRAGVGRSRARALLDEIGRAAQNIYARICPDLRRKVCPGVRPRCAAWSAGACRAAWSTGNLERIAWTKMRRAGLEGYFALGPFPATRRRAPRSSAWPPRAPAAPAFCRGARVVYIGDHPNDVRAAREAGARIVAVGTGVVSGDALLGEKPDLYVPDLRALRLDDLFSERP